MTTASAVRAAWDAGVWQDTTVKSLTAQIYDYDVRSIASVSKAHDALLRQNQEYNFIQYRVTKTRTYDTSNKLTCEFPVYIEHYKKADLTGDSYTEIEDGIETVFSAVRNNMGATWSGTVDYYEIQDGEPELSEDEINGEPVWAGRYSYKGIKIIDL